MAAKKKPKVSFEEGMQSLSDMVGAMQGGQLSLDEMMKTYERGMELAQHLEELLDAHQRKIEQIDLDTAEISEFKGE